MTIAIVLLNNPTVRRRHIYVVVTLKKHRDERDIRAITHEVLSSDPDTVSHTQLKFRVSLTVSSGASRVC